MFRALLRQRSNRARWVVYPVGAVALTTLVWMGFFHEPEPDAAAKLSSAEFLAKIGVLDDAEAQCDEVLRDEEDNLHAWLIKGLIRERRDDHPGAIAAYRHAIRLTDDSDLQRDCRLSIADLHRRAGDHDAALAELDRLDGGEKKVERLYGVLALDRNELGEALRRFEKLDQTPESATLVATALMRMKRFDEAEKRLATAEGARVSWPAWRELARGWLENGNRRRASEALARYARKDKKGPALLGRDPFWKRYSDSEEFEGLILVNEHPSEAGGGTGGSE